MANKLNITRRDFLNGVALSLAAGTSLSPLEILAMQAKSGVYPPALTGMRGSHGGSFEIAHAVARSGARFSRPDDQTDDNYDLVVVGGGISGLSAAYFYRQQAGEGKRVLVLDNHDDFGGHARRNEFDVGGEKLIGYGGSQSMESPSAYSKVSKGLLTDLGIFPQRFYEYFDQEYFKRRGMRPSIHFRNGVYGKDVTAPNVFGDYMGEADAESVEAVLQRYPISDESKKDIRRLLVEEKDYLDGMSLDAKEALLVSTSFSDYLQKYVGVTDEVVTLIRDSTLGYIGVGWDAASAYAAMEIAMPGTLNLGIADFAGLWDREEPYIFHFPDGNASIARALVRKLVPGSIPGQSMEDIVLSRADYDMLDRDEQSVRIRLNSTAVDVMHTANQSAVDIVYVRNGKAERVRAKHAILACYSSMIPYICSEIPGSQREAIEFNVKVPLAYISIAVDNWKAFAELGTQNFYVPQTELMYTFGMDFPVSMGGYEYTSSPDQPTVLHGTVLPLDPDKGLSDKEQFRSGRKRMLGMSFDVYERLIVEQLDGALSGGGFDADRDIAAITVNRWPHGYSYEYNDLFGPPYYSYESGPHEQARQQVGRISIANSDAAGRAYADSAIDEAYRAVEEQLRLT